MSMFFNQREGQPTGHSLFFRTSQAHICEKALKDLSHLHHDNIDFFGSTDYPAYPFQRRYIVPYDGFLDVHKIPADVLDELRCQNYKTIIFPYTVNGEQPYYNLLDVASAIQAEEVVFYSELGATAPQKVAKMRYKERLRVVYLFLFFAPILLLLLYWFFRDFVRMRINGGKPFGVTNNIVAIGGTTDIEIENLEKVRGPRIKIGCIARLDPVKGHVYLLEAFSKLMRQIDHVDLYLIGGGGKEMENLKQLANQLCISSNVHFEGMQQDIRRYLQECDMFVLPSLTEAMPISIIEVFAAKRPIIATRVGGVPKIVTEGENGLLVDAGSSEQLFSALLQLIRSPELAERIAENGHNRYKEELSPAILGNKFAQLYSECDVSGTHNNLWLFSSFDLTWVGGLTRYVELQKKTLGNIGFEVSVFQPPDVNYNIRCYLRGLLTNMIAKAFRMDKVIVEFYLRKLMVLYLFVKSIIRARPDMINAHDVIAYSALYRLCKWLRIPLVLIKHGELAKEIRIQKECSTEAFLYLHFAEQERFAYTKAKWLVVVDEESKLRLQKGIIAR